MAARPGSTALASTVNCYRLQCGLPVSMTSGAELIMFTGGQLDAIGMPAVLGGRVLRGLRIAMLAGPVLARPNSSNWIFLSTPIEDSRPDLLAGLAEIGVFVFPRGEPITVPADVHGRTPGWVHAPMPRCAPPPWQALLATARRSTVTDEAMVTNGATVHPIGTIGAAAAGFEDTAAAA